MAARELNELKRKLEKLSHSEKLQLMAYLAEQCRVGAKKASQRPRWREIRGMAPYPLTREDAQDWVSRTRAESDADRSLN
jgi:hypothetical protein